MVTSTPSQTFNKNSQTGSNSHWPKLPRSKDEWNVYTVYAVQCSHLVILKSAFCYLKRCTFVVFEKPTKILQV